MDQHSGLGITCISIPQSFLDTLKFQVYELNDLFDEVIIKLYNKDGQLIHTIIGNYFYLKQKSIIGRYNDHVIQVGDPYMHLVHAQLDWTNWFKELMPLVKEYSSLLRIRRLPISVCRHIAGFLKEPRRVTFSPLQHRVASWLALKQGVMIKVSTGQKFRLGERLKMKIEKVSTVQDEKDTFEELQQEIKKEVEFLENERIEQFEIVEHAHTKPKTFHIFCLMFTFKGLNKRYTLVSNKQHKKFTIGSSFEANISQSLNHVQANHPFLNNIDIIDKFQCEIVLNNGEWYLIDLPHEQRKKKTWLDVSSLKEKKYEITEDEELLLGKTTFKISFPNKQSAQKHVGNK